MCTLSNYRYKIEIWSISPCLRLGHERMVCVVGRCHYSDVIMGTIASQITSLTIVYLTVYSGADERKDQSSASLAFVRGSHRGPVNSPHKWPVTRKMFPFDDVIMYYFSYSVSLRHCSAVFCRICDVAFHDIYHNLSFGVGMWIPETTCMRSKSIHRPWSFVGIHVFGSSINGLWTFDFHMECPI